MTNRLRLVVLFAITACAAQANIIGYSNTFTNTNFVMSGVGMRNVGSGTLNVSGVSGTVTGALLYWQGPTNSVDPLSNAAVTFDGNDVRGTNIGLAADNCWGFSNSQAYFADVSPFVSGDGNYSLTNFTKGSDVNVNGAGLIVFYDDGDSTNNRDLVVFHGNDSNIASPYDVAGWQATLNGINYSGGNASMRFFVSDGQTFTDDAVLVNGVAITTGNQIFQGTSPGSNVGNGTLWDVSNFDITSLLNPGNNNLNLQCGAQSDCLSLVMLGVDLPAGAAPPPPGDVPEPSTWAMISAGLGGLVWLRRRR